MAVTIDKLKNRLPQIAQAKISDTGLQEKIDQAKKSIEITDFVFTSDQLDALTLELASYHLAVSLGNSYGVDPGFYLDLYKTLDKQYRACKSNTPKESRFNSVTAIKLRQPRNFA